ncbi:hypothetical protein ACHQM5_013354 [Ranunculus cassubicifolius]
MSSASNSSFLLHSSWHSANEIPTSTYTSYFQISSAFRQTPRRRKAAIGSSFTTPSPIRKPCDRFSSRNDLLSSSSYVSPLTSNASTSKELDSFLELVPLRMRNDLFVHNEILELIEVVMDLGRRPIARFP